MFTPSIDPSQFVALVKPLLESKDVKGLHSLLMNRWRPDQIEAILSGTHDDARKVAALSLALVGAKCCIPKLAGLLKHPDATVNQMVEHALWSIWFRCGTPQANQELCRGTQAMNHREYERAKGHFARAIELDPSFAEAYNQRAIVSYLEERFNDSIEDCRATIDRMPCHFGAWSGMGHCHAHEGQLKEALRSYEKAIEINPHLEGVRQMVDELRHTIASGGAPDR